MNEFRRGTAFNWLLWHGPSRDRVNTDVDAIFGNDAMIAAAAAVHGGG